MVESIVAERVGQRLTLELCRALVATAQLRAPQEACGFIRGDNLIYEFPNIALDPMWSFTMAGIWPFERSLFVWEGWWSWHSHPATRSIPSREDVSFMNQTQVPMIIVSLKGRPSIVLYGFAGRRIVQLAKWREG